MSDDTQAEAPNAAAENQEQAAPPTNFDRLIAHLRKDSLAANLVSAYAAADDGAEAQAIKDVMTGRLDELKNSHDNPEDQQD